MRTLVRMYLAAAVCVAAMAMPSLPRIYLLSDIHFDPFFATPNAVGKCIGTSQYYPYGHKSCDSGLPLLRSAITDLAARFCENGDGLILYGGDFVRHDVDKLPPADAMSVIRNATATIVKELAAALGRREHSQGGHVRAVAVPLASAAQAIAAAFGNEDNIPDYAFNPNVSAVHFAADNISDILQQGGWFTPNVTAAFRRCGYYAQDVFSEGLRLIVLNTLLYSPEHYPAPLQSPDPCGQLQWLSATLAETNASGRVAMIVGHIPPTPTRWIHSYLKAYRDVLKVYGAIVTVQWFAHTHMTEFFVLDTAPPMPLVINVPSISPRDGNNPSYLSVTFTNGALGGSAWVPQAIHQRVFLGNGSWGDGPVFPSGLIDGPPSLGLTDVMAYLTHLLSKSPDSTSWKAFEAMYQGGVVTNAMGHKDKAKALCDMTTWSPSDYDACKTKYE